MDNVSNQTEDTPPPSLSQTVKSISGKEVTYG